MIMFVRYTHQAMNVFAVVGPIWQNTYTNKTLKIILGELSTSHYFDQFRT